MNVFPDKAQFKELAGKGNMVPVYVDLMADAETPLTLYSRLSKDKPSFLFESVTGGEQISRYSFVGSSPREVFVARKDKCVFKSADGSEETVDTPEDPLCLLEDRMKKYNPVSVPGMPRFCGGAVGYVAYDYIHCIEPTVPVAKEDSLNMPLLYFMLTDVVAIFDHARQIIRVCSHAYVDGDIEEVYEEAVKRVMETVSRLREPAELSSLPLPEADAIKVPDGNFTRDAFEKAVGDVREYVHAGDAIQVVASQRFEADFPEDPLDLYRSLRVVNPSPYMFILDTGDYSIVGASPEVHVRLTDGLIESRPIAGTRPRGETEQEDLLLEKDLLADEKECAEHLMLVDLARNDLGRVCEAGKVDVHEFMIVERYSHVMHIVSQVQGTIDPTKNAYDVMRATFPAGTVSGAPKVRAMQIISELEGTQRGVYAGALGYFGFDGNHDSCIAIRTALLKDGKVYIQSGAGLVADSDPGSEYEETINKAKAMFKAVSIARKVSVEG